MESCQRVVYMCDEFKNVVMNLSLFLLNLVDFNGRI